MDIKITIGFDQEAVKFLTPLVEMAKIAIKDIEGSAVEGLDENDKITSKTQLPEKKRVTRGPAKEKEEKSASKDSDSAEDTEDEEPKKPAKDDLKLETVRALAIEVKRKPGGDVFLQNLLKEFAIKSISSFEASPDPTKMAKVYKKLQSFDEDDNV